MSRCGVTFSCGEQKSDETFFLTALIAISHNMLILILNGTRPGT